MNIRWCQLNSPIVNSRWTLRDSGRNSSYFLPLFVVGQHPMTSFNCGPSCKKFGVLSEVFSESFSAESFTTFCYPLLLSRFQITECRLARLHGCPRLPASARPTSSNNGPEHPPFKASPPFEPLRHLNLSEPLRTSSLSKLSHFRLEKRSSIIMGLKLCYLHTTY